MCNMSSRATQVLVVTPVSGADTVCTVSAPAKYQVTLSHSTAAKILLAVFASKAISAFLYCRRDRGRSSSRSSHPHRGQVSQPIPEFEYRATHDIVSNLPLTSKQKFRFDLAWPGQNGTFVLRSTGGLIQHDVSPCISL